MALKKPPVYPTSVRLPADLKKALQRSAVRDDRTFNGQIVYALKFFLRQGGPVK